jgi:hypothetical protein
VTTPNAPETPAPIAPTGVLADPVNGSRAVPAPAVAETPQQSAAREALAALSPEKRAEIMLRRQANIVTAQIASTNWGKGMDADTAKAVSDWGQRNGIDVTKEIFILGGNIYLNAEFYLNRLATLIERGRVLDWRQSFVNIDARLDESNPIDRAEIARRRDARVRFNIPDEATSAVVTELELASMPGVPIIGVKWAPRSASDPIGKAFPQETALTRSARRCLRQAVRYLPEIATYVTGAEEDAAATVSATIVEAARRRHEIAEAGAKQLAAGPAAPLAAAEHTAGAVAREAVNVAAAATAPDPYTGAEVTPPPAPPAAGSMLAGAPTGRSADVEVIDDLDLLTPAERAEHAARAAAERQAAERQAAAAPAAPPPPAPRRP